MRFSVALVSHCSLRLQPAPSSVVSREEFEVMQLEALADTPPEQIHERFEVMRENPHMVVDRLNGRASGNPYDDCANTPIRAKRSDGTTVIKHVDVCD